MSANDAAFKSVIQASCATLWSCLWRFVGSFGVGLSKFVGEAFRFGLLDT